MDICNYVRRHHAGTVRRIWDETAATGREHGTVLYGDGRSTGLTAGREADVGGYQTGAPAGAKRKVTLHTHPSNNVAPSLRDLTSVASAWQFPPARKQWSDPSRAVRGLAIASSRLGEEGVTVHAWTANRAALSMDVDGQQAVSREAHSIANGTGPAFRKKEQLSKFLSQYVDECYVTI